ncbi:phosphotriesterase family protein [Nocardioides luteus]|uniref:phosphotriesterase family protein n=1 Tax=Nocardioides luteus TaxID=1844 RepID=UPI0018CB9A70|nr:hypothetical protein [Nocardioides luteus]MBG6095814.1 phosphotriesterase-related protein [Nocardioides luteus]
MSHQLRTVLGDIDPSAMGGTLPHEHLQGVCDMYWYPGDDPLADSDPDASPRLDNLWHWMENPVANRGNMHMTDEQDSIDELRDLPGLGIGTVVNLTPIGMHRNAEGLRRISEASGVNIVAGSTYYVAEALSKEVKALMEEEITRRIVDDIEVGMDGTAIRAGIVGEVGLSWPIDPVEERVLAASVQAHLHTGAALSIHNPYYVPGSEAMEQVAKLIAGFGADMSRVIMGHCDGFTRDPRFYDIAREYGCYVELDMFGYVSGYEAEIDFTYPADSDRVDAILRMIEEGMADRLLLSHDMVFKTTLKKYGGFGLGRIHRVIKPWLERRGVDAETLEQILVRNAQTVLPMRVPATS